MMRQGVVFGPQTAERLMGLLDETATLDSESPRQATRIRPVASQWVALSSLTLTDGRYSGHWYQFDSAANDFDEMDEVWIVAADGRDLATGTKYLGRAEQWAASKPVFVVAGDSDTTTSINNQTGPDFTIGFSGVGSKPQVYFADLTNVPLWTAGWWYPLGFLVHGAGSHLYQCILAHKDHEPPNATYWRDVNDEDVIAFGFGGTYNGFASSYEFITDMEQTFGGKKLFRLISTNPVTSSSEYTPTTFWGTGAGDNDLLIGVQADTDSSGPGAASILAASAKVVTSRYSTYRVSLGFDGQSGLTSDGKLILHAWQSSSPGTFMTTTSQPKYAVVETTISSGSMVHTLKTGAWSGVFCGGIYCGGAIGTSNGGTGATSLTAHGLLLGQGTSAMTALVLTNNQIPMGATGSDPTAFTVSANPKAFLSTDVLDGGTWS